MLGTTAECLGITRADYLEKIVRDKDCFLPSNTWQEQSNSPSNTRQQEEIERLKAEIWNLSQSNTLLLEQATRARTQIPELEAMRDHVLFELKLGKPAPGYKAAQKARLALHH